MIVEPLPEGLYFFKVLFGVCIEHGSVSSEKLNSSPERIVLNFGFFVKILVG